MKIFITGGTGFIGQHLIELLSEDPVEIYVLSRKQNPEFWCEKKNIRLVHGDIAESETYKGELLQCDILVNLAAEIRDEKKLTQTNIEGAEKLLSVAAISHIKKIIHLSSVGVTGAGSSVCKRTVDESAECKPKNAYEISKFKSENIFLDSGSKTKTFILRPTNVFGDHHPRSFLLSLLRRADKGKLLLAGKCAKFNYIYAGDVANVIASFIREEFLPGIYHVGSPSGASDFFGIIKKYSNKKSKIVLCPSLFFYPAFLLKPIGKHGLFQKMLSLINKVEYSDTKLINTMKYKYGIDEGLRRTIEFYERSGFFKN